MLIFRLLQIRDQLKTHRVVLSDRLANFYGLSTIGPGQIRGNGWLALTEDSLIFEMYVPARSLNIPLGAITSVDTAPAHLGKTGKAGSRLLRIKYAAGTQEESVAWRVEHLPQWVISIADSRRQHQ